MKKLSIITAVLLIAFLVTGGLASAQDLDENITKISFEGNENIARETIMEAVKTEIGDEFDREKLRSDMQSIMELGYFQDISASFNNYEDGLEVVFKVVENPIISEIEITGNEIYSEEKIMEMSGVKKGEVLNVKALNDGLKELRNNYQDEGYILASYKNVNISEDGILSLDIDVGHVNEVIIKGNEKTKDYVIRRELDVEKGDILKLSDVQEAYRNLYRLQYFKNIQPDFKRVEGEDNLANIIITVEEGKTGQFNFGAGYGTGGDSGEGSWFGYLNLKEENLLGRGQSLSFDTRIGNTTTYSLSFQEPWLMGTKNSFGVSIYNRKTDGKENNEGEKYDETRRGGSLSLGRPLTEMWDGNVKYRLEETKYNWVDDNIEDTEDRTSSLTFKVDRDTSNHPFNPDGGAIDIFTLETAGGILQGDNTYQKLSADLRRYYPGFKDEHAWALRGKIGFGFDDIPLSDKYYVGGANTVRGYDESVNGDDMFLVNAEYRFPVVDKITGVVFLDSGNAWEDRKDMSLEDMRTSAGLGARMNTPLGQLRLDYGWTETGDGKFHFSIGNTF
ncbi:MAG: BamA/OMP85 family outer membrane protein [Bacillota bacterium]